MGARRGFMAFAALVVVFGVGLAAPQAQAASEGSKCSKAGSTAESGKTTLKCVRLVSGSFWLKLTPTPSSSAAGRSQLAKWRSSLTPAWTADAEALLVPEKLQAAADAVAPVQADRDAKAAVVAQSNATAAAIKAQIDALPGQISSADSAYKTAKAALVQPGADADAAEAKADSLWPAYLAASDARSTVIRCQAYYGYYGACGSTAPYGLIISQWRSANSAAIAAIDKYNALVRVSNQKLADLKALIQQQTDLPVQYNTALAQVQNDQAILDDADRAVQAANGRVVGQSDLRTALDRLASSTQSTRKALSVRLTGSSWSNEFESAALAAGKHRLLTAQAQRSYAKLAALG